MQRDATKFDIKKPMETTHLKVGVRTPKDNLLKILV